MEPGGELSEHCVVGRGGQGRISAAALAAADSVMSPRERRDIFLDGRERRRGEGIGVNGAMFSLDSYCALS